jgi:hypothetical protein
VVPGPAPARKTKRKDEKGKDATTKQLSDQFLALLWPTTDYSVLLSVVRKCLIGAWVAKTRSKYLLWLECGALLSLLGCSQKHLWNI